MPEFPSTGFQTAADGLFSKTEVRRLMEIEVQRSRRYGYPLVCMAITVDRLEQLHSIYGFQSKEEVVGEAGRLFRAARRASDYLGYREDDRFVALFPHATPDAAGRIAERLILEARKSLFEANGRLVQISVSVGFTDGQEGRIEDLAGMVALAEEAMWTGVKAGGDRFVHGDQMQDELQELAAEIERRMKEREAAQLDLEAPEEERRGLLRDADAEALVARLTEIFEAQGDVDPKVLAVLQDKVIGAALDQFAGEQLKSTEERLKQQDRELDLLRRRLNKLTDLLGVTEDELRRVMKMKAIDPGLSSIYRGVQGLDDEEDHYKQKEEMMKVIFQANLALQGKS